MKLPVSLQRGEISVSSSILGHQEVSPISKPDVLGTHHSGVPSVGHQPFILLQKCLSGEIPPSCGSAHWGWLFFCFGSFCQPCLCSSYPSWCGPSILHCRQKFIYFFQIFFSGFTVIWLSVFLCGAMHGVHWVSKISRSMFSIKFGKILVVSIYFYKDFCFPFTWISCASQMTCFTI